MIPEEDEAAGRGSIIGTSGQLAFSRTNTSEKKTNNPGKIEEQNNEDNEQIGSQTLDENSHS